MDGLDALKQEIQAELKFPGSICSERSFTWVALEGVSDQNGEKEVFSGMNAAMVDIMKQLNGSLIHDTSLSSITVPEFKEIIKDHSPCVSCTISQVGLFVVSEKES